MTLCRLDEVLRTAAECGRGVGAFNVIQIEHAEAIVAGAEATGLPVVLQISENAVRYHGALAPIALATKAVAERATVPLRAAPGPRGHRVAGRRGGRARVHVGHVRRVPAAMTPPTAADPSGRPAVPRRGRQRRGRARRDRRQGRRARAGRAHRPGRGRGVRRGHRRRRARRGGGLLARDDQPDAPDRPRPRGGHPRGGAGAAGAARVVRGAGRRPRGCGGGRDDQGQHRDAPERRRSPRRCGTTSPPTPRWSTPASTSGPDVLPWRTRPSG